MSRFLFLAVALLLPACSFRPPSAPEPLDLGAYFEGTNSTFVLLDEQTGEVIRHDSARSTVPLLPASTFKIPHTLIALETGIAPDPDFALEWDSTRAPRQEWWPDSWTDTVTLRTALPESVVWFYQELARRIGRERMQLYLDRFDYGNRSLRGGIDRFWLDGGLRISAEEQVRFLQRFYRGQLGVSTRTNQITRELMTIEETPAYRFAGKTGTALPGDGTEIGWFVGFVERDGNVYYFAMNEIGEEGTIRSRDRRIEVTREVLRALGALPLPG